MSAKPSTNTTPQSPKTFARYRGLILSIAIFLLLIIALMFYSTLSSRLLAQQAAQLSVIEQLHSQYQQSVQRTYNLGIGTFEGMDPKTPFMKRSIHELRNNSNRLQESLNILKNGGELISEEGTTLKVPPLTQEHLLTRIKNIETLWQPVSTNLATYLKTADSVLGDDAPLNEAIVHARNTHEDTHAQIDAILVELTQTVQNHTRTLTIVQLAGIAAAVIYFIIFINYFMRKLRRADESAEEARNETSEILNTVTSGLFLLDRDLQIGNQYSAELENLIGTRDIAHRNLLDILRTKLPDSELENTEEFIGQLYSPHVKERLIGSLNPLIRTPMRIANIKTGEEQNRYLSFRFNRVYHGKDIARVLVNVTDETNAVLLEQKIEQEREQNDIQLDMLSTLLSADQKMVNDFIKNTQRRNIEINEILKAPGEKQTDLRNKANAIFREVHSLKGEASTFKLDGFTVLAESLENEIKALQSAPSLSGEDFFGLAVYLEKLMQLTQTIADLARRLDGGNRNALAEQVMSSLHPKDRFDEAASQQAYYARFVSELAERNHKKVTLTCSGLETELSEQAQTLVKEAVIQLLRNAVVHGIESPEERQAKNKPPVGNIRLVLSESEQQYSLMLQDDGTGIQAERIRAKAIREGICTAEQAAQLNTKQLYGLLFRPGFSTAEAITGDAGRGVGLDIIKERIAKMGGKISIASTPDEFTRFAFTFPKQ